MSFQLIMFYTLAAIILFGALKTVTAKNPVHAALYLVLTFCMSAMMWMLMQAEFLGITLVVVYVGAVMVLFLFVVMMLNIDIEEMRKGFWRNAPVAAVVGVLMALLGANSGAVVLRQTLHILMQGAPAHIDQAALVPDESLTLREGAVRSWGIFGVRFDTTYIR